MTALRITLARLSQSEPIAGTIPGEAKRHRANKDSRNDVLLETRERKAGDSGVNQARPQKFPAESASGRKNRNRPAMIARIAQATLVLALLLWTSECDLAGVFVKTQADVTKRSTAPFTHWDTELVEHALANNLILSEGFLEIAPDYEPLLLLTVLTYVGYGQMWLEERFAAAQAASRYDEAERLNRRSGLLYDRALVYAKRMLRLRDKGFDAALSGGEKSFEKWTKVNFYKKRDAEVPLVASLAWFATMQASDDGVAAATDRPFAEILARRSVQLDPGLRGAVGLMALGIVECSVPAFMGGMPQKGKAYLQRAARITNRKNHGVLVALAEVCAVQLQDRALFKSLLTEVVEAKDVEEYRLLNKFARRKAERLLGQIDELFL
ncbi:MAG: hypothetical protein JXA30_03610 [Deltaproteobacteria bacterium]|nr:hypothetical protein [Deltaproteobacteria bacterium]